MKKIFILGAVLISSILLFAQQTEGNDKALQIGASYTGDNVAVLAGGLKRGYNYLGLAHLNLTFDTERARLWKGGTFFLNASNTHGGTPSEDLIGDFQIASNIEAGEHTYLQELWYKQGFDRFEITAGLQDLNVEISVVDNGSVFINSSFGILPVISTNLHAPIFPLTSLGLTTRWDITENISWLNAIYDGSPIDFDNNPYNLSWQLNRGDGFLFVTEFQNKVSLFHRHAHYKLGAFSHNHYLEKVIHPDLADSLVHTVSGAYLIYEQNILQKGERTLNSFVQTGFSPSGHSINRFYLGMGVNLNGFLSKNEDDVLGLAVAHARMKEQLGHETLFELTWKKQISPCFYIQPDIQYIFHPSGSQSGIPNAFAAMFRFGFEM